VLAVVVFVVIGRASHHHGQTLGGFLSTVWPFAAGLAVGEVLVAFGRSRSLASPWMGAVVAVSTVAVGMVLRVVGGQGTAAAFVVVAMVFLGAVMTGGRLVGAALARRLSPTRPG
jgi:hypothetical protein